MQAQDVMTKNVITAAADTTVEEVTVLMMDNHISAIPIVDGAGSIVGIVSEGDLMRRVEKPGKVQKSWWLSLFSGSDNTAEDFIAMRGRHAGDIMSRKVEVVAANTPVSDIARLLEKKRIKRVPVVTDGQLIGIVSRANLLQALATVTIVTLDTSASDRQKREIALAALAEVPGLNPAHLNVVVEGNRVDVWGIAGTNAHENAARVALDNIDGFGEVSVNLGLIPDYMWE